MGLYRLHDDYNAYKPFSSTINIYKLDTAKRVLKATFNIQARDSTNRMLNITNGQLVLDYWDNF